MSKLKTPLTIKIYTITYRIMYLVFGFTKGCLGGFWLGIFEKRTLGLMSEFYYNNHEIYKFRKDYSDKVYDSEEYNKRGLWPWEKEAIDRYFKKSKCLLVGAAGGGREVLALRRLGYEVDGFECHPTLVKYANELLKKERFPSIIKLAPRNQCPISDKVYDGIIIGWSAYALIKGRRQRIAFLKDLRKLLKEDSPILFSFFHRFNIQHRFRLIMIIGNALKWILRKKEYLEEGDDLMIGYVHYFTLKEIASELREAGFKLEFYCIDFYTHAVGVASGS